ncbi:hypothetical protein [Bosea sp. 124]|uniref:GCG_CRPN prefix-to-repeats domain-containing protein n=1 Tax=Bosea sp. 124 TaxID=2135642 RepID=UPI000D3B7A92|nr:hypothetical protein [Bosea sp. 124]PTM42692.1 hypothetical protein C8D03_4286 [Bosea sp. 124]
MKTFLAAALMLAGAAFAAPASALPLVPPGAVPDLVVAVAGGCGQGFHRGPNGGCLRNYANPGAHPCPRGYHVGPGGRCRGNGR